MIPLRDDNPTHSFPFVTIFLIAVNIAVYLMTIPFGRDANADLIKSFGFVPQRFFECISSGRILIVGTIFSSMFLHGGIIHLIGNMLYLWIFGNNIEDILGKFRFVLFYCLCGIGAAFMQGMIKPDSVIPMIGASGAVSGILGAYIIRFPRAKVSTLVFLFFFINIIRIPAVIFLGFWIVFQLFAGMGSFASQGGGVAFFAHIGGFITGIILSLVFSPKNKRIYLMRRRR